jgi:hypothetical protein
MRIVLAMCVVAACGSPTNPLIDAPVAHNDGPDHLPDAPSVDAPPLTGRSGLVSLAESPGDSNAGATFAIGDVLGAAVGTDGPCTVTMNPAQDGLSAGAIAVTGTTTALTLTPTGTAPSVNYDTMPAAPTDLFTAGATISISAAGGPDFPAFNTTVTAPATLAGFTPPTALSRAGYTAHWTAGTESIWVIMIATDQGFANLTYTICRVPDTGTFAIPASTFALIPAGSTQSAIGVGRVSSSDVVTTAGHVTVAAVSNITSELIPLGP